MMTRSIDLMQSRPGIYVVVGLYGVFLCEVEVGGRCIQLKPETLAQDGELRPGLWNLDAITTIVGPLARCPARETA